MGGGFWENAGILLEGVLVVYGGLLLLLWGYARKNPDTVALREALRLLPDLLRLLKRLLADPALGWSVRLRVVLLLGYLLLPFDLVPDFVPLIGYADDAVVVALVLRSVIRSAGAEAIERHWPGTQTGLQLVLTLAGGTSPK